ncbi:MAG TPA: nuclear transport factor 2 family protein [Acidimicrobiia bacterium]|jgi:ketosteroid isomerase-like protein
MADPTIAELTERLACLEAERAIVGTLYAYGLALDYGDGERFLACFTPDAEYVVEMRIEGTSGFTFRGHDELTQYFEGHTHAPDAWHKHITTNPSVTVRGSTADATSYFVRVDAGAESGPAVVLASGRYVDELERGEDGSWRIRSRRCEVENL